MLWLFWRKCVRVPYKEGGIEKLKEVNFYKPQSELTKHKSSIEAYFKEHPPASVKEAMTKIEELTLDSQVFIS